MNDRPESRTNPRLKLRYGICVERTTASGSSVIARTVTQNVAARGAYFSTFEAEQYEVGQEVSVTVTVPHRLAAGGPEVLLDLRGLGRVVRIEGPDVHRRYGEDGASLAGVAIAFDGSLSFQYRWV